MKNQFREHIIKKHYKSLSNYIDENIDISTEVIEILLSALGFLVFKVDTTDSQNKISFGHTEALLNNSIHYDKQKKEYQGDYMPVLNKVFLTIQELERTINKTVFYPKEMRQSSIDIFCKRNNINTKLFSLILSNW